MSHPLRSGARLTGGAGHRQRPLALGRIQHDTKEYGAALEVLGNGAERDIRIVEGVA